MTDSEREIELLKQRVQDLEDKIDKLMYNMRYHTHKFTDPTESGCGCCPNPKLETDEASLQT